MISLSVRRSLGLWLSDCDWGAMLELDFMRCSIGGSSNAKTKYHYSVRSNLSVGSLHDLQWNKGRSSRFRSQSPHSSNSYIYFGYRSLDQCRIQACLHLCIYLYYLNSFMCVVSRLDVCGGPSALLTA